MPERPTPKTLPSIPVLATGADFPMATLVAETARAHLLLDGATRGVPRTALRALDAVSRRWLTKWDNAHLPEIDAIAAKLARPGAYFLAVNYEWGCSVSVGASPDGRTARLARTLDWMTPGLGRHVMAAQVAGTGGPFVTLTWPGFTGVLQAMAPGRFSAALNQAPLRKIGGGFYPVDWVANRARVWRTPHPTPAHVLRTVFETAANFQEAKALLTTSGIAAPAIFTLAGIAGHETCVIERTEDGARVIEGRACATNHWQSTDGRTHARGHDSSGRLACMQSDVTLDLDSAFPWLTPPVLNDQTRIAMVADAAQGRLIAQGYEKMQAATQPLVWSKASMPARV